MKSFLLAGVLLLAFFAHDCVAPPPRCDYRRIGLGIAIDEETCRENCRTFNQAGTSGCFAYHYVPAREDCAGYTLEYNPGYSSYNDCGVIAGANLAYNETQEDASASVPSETGCSLGREDLGVARTAEACELECRDLVSGIYYGCAAWLYDRSEERCIGILAESRGNNAVCGTP